MSLSKAMDALGEISNDLCEDEQFRNRVNSFGPTLAGVATSAIAGQPAGTIVASGCRAISAVDERFGAKILTDAGLCVAAEFIKPALIVLLAGFAVADALGLLEES